MIVKFKIKIYFNKTEIFCSSYLISVKNLQLNTYVKLSLYSLLEYRGLIPQSLWPARYHICRHKIRSYSPNRFHLGV